MSTIAVYPAHLDPITNGHTEFGLSAIKILFEKVIVAVAGES